MDANELEACLYKGALVLLDVRYRLGGPSGFEEYVERHIPGAHYVDLDTALAAPPDERGRHPLPDVAAFEAAMRAAGVCNDVPVVVYDDWSGRAAARCWWLLRWAGHTNVRVLDGGLGAWRGGVAQGSSPTAPGDFVARPGAMPQVDAEDVLAQSCLIHARAPSRFRGDEEPVDPVAGHIPGSNGALWEQATSGREAGFRVESRGLRGCRVRRRGRRPVDRRVGGTKETTSNTPDRRGSGRYANSPRTGHQRERRGSSVRGAPGHGVGEDAVMNPTATRELNCRVRRYI